MKNILASAVVKNILWLSFDKIFRLFVALVVGIWVARYLGPSDYGKLNYVLAFISIIIAFSTLGIDNFLVKELIERPQEKESLMGTAFILRLTAVLISSLIILPTFFALSVPANYYQIYFILLLTAFVTPFDVIDIEYQSVLSSKKTVVAKNISFACGAFFKLYLIFIKADFTWFVWAVALETLTAYLILLAFYQKSEKSVFSWGFKTTYIKELLQKGWPFIISGIAVIIYMRLDQIMLGSLLGSRAVGEFSAAVKVSEMFHFIPLAISSSLFAPLIKIKKEKGLQAYHDYNQNYFNWLFLISFAIALFITLLSPLIINILYGKNYAESTSILQIYVWSIVPVFLGVASGNYLVIEGLQKYTFYRSVIGLVINLLLNFIFIPKFGGQGAAISTLISQCVASILANCFFKQTVFLFRMQIRSFNVFEWLFKKSNYQQFRI